MMYFPYNTFYLYHSIYSPNKYNNGKGAVDRIDKEKVFIRKVYTLPLILGYYNRDIDRSHL